MTQIDDTQIEKLSCGIVRPISSLDGCPFEHWIEVHNIICEAVGLIDEPRFAIKLVSDENDVGIIQKRIIQNIYNSDIVICDLSGKNPNVMFELGMRLAFDKPAILICDDKTNFSFDTGVIEHIIYPRDLRFSKIQAFKTLLSEKVLATYLASLSSNYSSFIKSFGAFEVVKLSEVNVSPDKMIVGMLEEMRMDIGKIKFDLNKSQNLDIFNPIVRFPRASPVEKIIESQIRSYLGKNPGLSPRKTDLNDLCKTIDSNGLSKSFSSESEFIDTVDRILKAI